MRRWICIIVGLLVLVTPTYATIYRADVTIDKSLDPSKSYYISGEIVHANYSLTIEDDKAEELSGKYFEICTELSVTDIYNNFTVKVGFLEGGGITYPSESKHIKKEENRTCIVFKSPSGMGVQEIKIKLKAGIPEPEYRIATLTAINISCEPFAENVLENLTVKVVNKNKFNSDIRDYENRIKELEKDKNELSKQYVVTELEAVLKAINIDLDKAKDHLIREKFIECESYLSKIDRYFEEYEKLKNKIIADDLKKTLAEKFRDAEDLLREIDINITVLQKEGKIDYVLYTRFTKDLEKLEDRLEDLKSKSQMIDAQYYSKELYNKSVTEFEKLLNETKNLLEDLNDFKEDVDIYFAVQPGILDKLKDYWMYILFALILISVLLLGIKLGKRGKRWDELK